MKIHILLTAAGSLALLSACNNEPEVAEVETPVVADTVGTDMAAVPATTTVVAWDTNNDGLFDQNEYNAYRTQAFGAWDVNRDNRLDRTEFDQGWTAAGWRDPNAAWTAFDDNTDNFLETGEFFGEDEFGEWDRNRSGILENDEWFAS